MKLISLASILAFTLTISSCEKTYDMHSDSSEPAIDSGDIVNADMEIYEKSDPKRWEMVVFLGEQDQDWLSRVVGLPGEEINLTDSGLFINGKRETYHEQALKI